MASNYAMTWSSTGTATETLTWGNGTTETIQYSHRMQPVARTVVKGAQTHLNLAFGFGEPGTNKNNGNVWLVTDNLSSTYSQSFQYDALNRITNFWSGGMGAMTFGVDRYGNRHTQSATGPAPNKIVTISESRNRITSGGYAYDNAGNMTDEPGKTYQYDAENRIKSVGQGTVATYQYDGNGRRAVKNSASGTRIYFYDIAGRPVAESGPTGVWLSGHAYFQNRHVFENTGSQLLWRHPDHLGTAVVRSAVALVGSVR